MNTGGFVALGASLALLASYEASGGAGSLGRRVLEISELACRKLQAAGCKILSDRRPGAASGIISFEVPGKNPIVVRRHLLDHSVVVSCRAGKLRISPHAYTSEADLDRLVAGIRSAE